MKEVSISFAVILLLLTGCVNKDGTARDIEEHQGRETKQYLSIWLPEWQVESAIKDVKNSFRGLQSIRVFGVYFNEEDKPLVTNKVVELYRHIDKNHRGKQPIILTFINDFVVEGQAPVQKDSSLLYRFVKDEGSRKQHINDIIAMTEQFNVDGVEIDYEKINVEDVINYTLFLQELYDALKQRDLTLHVVLDPNFQFETLLPDGPSYTVMAYNVHGYHSGPGAKTTFEFLDQLLDKLKQSNQHFDIAFATGGFTWPQNGRAVALTGIEAERLIDSKAVTTSRDTESAAIHFNYEKDGEKGEVWYADTTTLQEWVAYVQEKDPKYEHFILWRAGGLTPSTLDWINNH